MGVWLVTKTDEQQAIESLFVYTVMTFTKWHLSFKTMHSYFDYKIEKLFWL